MFMSTIDNRLSPAFHRKGNAPVTFAVDILPSGDTAPAKPSPAIRSALNCLD